MLPQSSRAKRVCTTVRGWVLGYSWTILETRRQWRRTSAGLMMMRVPYESNLPGGPFGASVRQMDTFRNTTDNVTDFCRQLFLTRLEPSQDQRGVDWRAYLSRVSSPSILGPLGWLKIRSGCLSKRAHVAWRVIRDCQLMPLLHAHRCRWLEVASSPLREFMSDFYIDMSSLPVVSKDHLSLWIGHSFKPWYQLQ
jgi:hypothetical protein